MPFISHLEVSWNSGTPKSSIFIGFSIKNYPFGVPPFMETPMSVPEKSRFPIPPLFFTRRTGSCVTPKPGEAKLMGGVGAVLEFAGRTVA